MKLTVLGAGCWGLTLAWLLTDNFEEVCVWGREQDLSEELKSQKRCSKPLSVQLKDKVEITSNLQSAIKDADIILLVVATSGIRSVCNQIAQIGLKKEQIIVNLSKGLEQDTLLRMSEVMEQELPDANIAVLSGPTLAKEVLMGMPTLASVASKNLETAKKVQQACSVPNRFRLYTNPDIVGVELGGSLKNVIAIASGFADAMGL